MVLPLGPSALLGSDAPLCVPGSPLIVPRRPLRRTEEAETLEPQGAGPAGRPVRPTRTEALNIRTLVTTSWKLSATT